MRCPICGKRTKTITSRTDNVSTYRKHECPCGNVFYTEEKIGDSDTVNRAINDIVRGYRSPLNN